MLRVELPRHIGMVRNLSLQVVKTRRNWCFTRI